MALVGLLLLSAVFSSGIGALTIGPYQLVSILLSSLGLENFTDFSESQAAVLLSIRIPRVLMSIAVGFALALSGTAIQGLFRNPLADPSIIGVSSGATLFAAVSIVLLHSINLKVSNWIGLSSLSILSFLGAMLSGLVIFRIATKKTEVSVATMLLAGIAFNALSMALTALLSYITTESQLRNLMFWTMGSLGGAHWSSTAIMLVVAVVSVLFLLPLGKHLNALSLGESEAIFLGTPVERVKKTTLLFSSLAIGVSVAFCGIIGFVGLVVPHILRTMGVTDYKKLLIYSGLFGAILLCWTDSLARTVLNPAEIPIGIITALAGAPIFMFLLTKFRPGLA